MNDYPVVGRNNEIDLDEYLVEVHGRKVVDYEKLQREKPELYKRILEDEKVSETDTEFL